MRNFFRVEITGRVIWRCVIIGNMGIQRSAEQEAEQQKSERIIDATVSDNNLAEQAEEISLRPLSFADYVGQERLKKNLKLAIDAVKKRDDGTTLDHVLLYGPPGLGKTTMANIIAHELGANLRVTSGGR